MKTKLLMLLTIFFWLTSEAQKWINYKTNNGLVSDTVFTVAIDAQGNKWFGTPKGVSKFNDTIWKTYTTADGLLSNNIQKIRVDKNNKVWLGSNKGLNTFDGSTWMSFTALGSFSNPSVICICFDSKENVWIGTNLGIAMYDGKVWKNFTTSDGLSSNYITAIAEDKNGIIWATGYITSKYNGILWSSPNLQIGNQMSSVSVDKQNTKWLCSSEMLSTFDNTNTKTIANIFMIGPINYLLCDADNNKWLCTSKGGVNKYNSSNQLTTFSTSTSGIANNCIYDIGIDSKSNKWFGTKGGVSELANISVTVSADPTESCDMAISNLSATPSNGIAPYTYAWTSSAGISTNLVSPVVISKTNTTYTVTITDATSATATGSVAVVVHQKPTVNFSADIVSGCTRLTVQFTDSSSAIAPAILTNCKWDFGDGTIDIARNPKHTFVQGKYIVTHWFDDSNRCTNIKRDTITVNPLPATPVITQNNDSLISDAPAGNQWYMASGSIAKATNAFYIPQATDDYYVITTDNNKCSSNKSNVIHFNYELFSIDTLYAPITQPVKDSITLTLIDSCLFNYTQSMDTFYIASAQVSNGKMQFNWVFKQGVKTYNLSSSIDVSKLQNGYNLIYLTIQCNITKKKGMLLKNTFAAPYTITILSIENIKQSALNVKLYPNPASDKFTIQIDNLKEAYTLEILNTTGQVVLNKRITNSVEQVDLSGQAAGVYFVKLQSVNNSVVRKIVKQN